MRDAISAMSVPVGPHGSLEVAKISQLSILIGYSPRDVLTISHLDLRSAIALGDILDTSDYFRHISTFSRARRSFKRGPSIDVFGRALTAQVTRSF